MPLELRLCYSDAYLENIADCLAGEADISQADFLSFVQGDGWENLALKQRMARLTEALVQFLPGDFEENIAILKTILPAVSTKDFKYADMLSMFVPEYVAAQGKEALETSLDALAVFTSTGTTSELAIRPFILDHPERVMKRMLEWASHTHPHVRRFASEGCRPRLPWAMALPDFKKDPSLVMPVLETLKRDDSLFVRKSVANNLNDIAKDNPETVLSFAGKHLGSHKHTDWIIKHGCRTLLKNGNGPALALFGSGPAKLSSNMLRLDKDMVQFGSDLTFEFEATLAAPTPHSLRIDYAIDFVKANGKQSRKIFRLSDIKNPDKAIAVRKSHRFIDYSTRKHYAGEHAVAIILNGEEVVKHTFTLLL